jgi:hypothetical protein
MDTNLGNGRESAADHLHKGSDPGLDTLNRIRGERGSLADGADHADWESQGVGSLRFRGDGGLGLVDEGPE